MKTYLVEMLLQLLICEINAELLKTVTTQNLVKLTNNRRFESKFFYQYMISLALHVCSFVPVSFKAFKTVDIKDTNERF